ncbi:MAG: acyloxyacyl hydrolase [Burkholderiales bacterium]
MSVPLAALRRPRVIVAVAALVALTAAPAHAIDGVSLELGTGDGVDMGRAGVQWDWNVRWLQGANWHVGGYWDVALGYWKRRDTAPDQHDDLVDLGVTPVFRFQPNGFVGPYVEAGIGFHLLSHSSIGDKRMSTAFQFGDHIGIGYRFGAKSGYDVGYRFQHVSNGGIKHPNSGINFHQVRVQYRF